MEAAAKLRLERKTQAGEASEMSFAPELLAKRQSPGGPGQQQQQQQQMPVEMDQQQYHQQQQNGGGARRQQMAPPNGKQQNNAGAHQQASLDQLASDSLDNFYAAEGSRLPGNTPPRNHNGKENFAQQQQQQHQQQFNARGCGQGPNYSHQHQHQQQPHPHQQGGVAPLSPGAVGAELLAGVAGIGLQPSPQHHHQQQQQQEAPPFDQRGAYQPQQYQQQQHQHQHQHQHQQPGGYGNGSESPFVSKLGQELYQEGVSLVGGGHDNNMNNGA